MKAIYLSVDGKQTGPYTQDQLRQAIEQGQVARETPAWYEGLTEWVPASGLVTMPPPPAYTPPPPPVVAPTQQGKVASQAHPHVKTRPSAMITGGIILLVMLAGAAAWWMISPKVPGSSQAAPSANPIVEAVTSVVAKQGSQFLGTWVEVSGNGSKTITIEDNGDQFLLVDGSAKVGAVFKDGLLMVGATTAITYIKSSDHITISGLVGYAEYARQSPATALIQQGATDLQQKNWDQAIADYSHAIELDSNNATAYAFRGDAKRMKGDYDNAIVDLTTALKINPNYAEAYYGRGRVYSEKGERVYSSGKGGGDMIDNYSRAIADFTNALRLNTNPNFMELVYLERADAYSGKGDYDNAVADCTDVLSLNPKNAFAYTHRAYAYSLKGDFASAIADYSMTLKNENGFNAPRDYWYRGYAYYNNGNLAEALADFQKSLPDDGGKITYGDFGVLFAIWLIEVEENRQTDGPNRELSVALQKYSGSPTDFEPEVGHYLIGDLTEDSLLKAAGEAPDDCCEANFFIGIKHFLNGDTAGAKAFFQKSIDTGDKNNLTFISAKAKLARLSSVPSQ